MTIRSVHHRTLWSQIADLPHVLEFPEIAGTRTRVLRMGSGTRTVLMLAGTSGHIEAFTHNLRALSEHYQIIAYDYPGHGYSTLARGRLEIADYVEHLLALMDHYDLDRPHLCGESLGGWIALKVAQQCPERFASLILSAPGGRMIPADRMQRAQSVSRQSVQDPSWENIRARLNVVIHDVEAISDELIAVRQAIYAQPGFLDSMNAILALQDPETRRRNSVTDTDYENQPLPALLIWTDHEPSGDPEVGRALADKMPHGRFELVEGAAHWPQWEEPERFNEAVLRFLREQP
ncbi:alpha/beta hydrolase [Actinomadura sp. 7K507]|uniref:alpha/beta fold hydrolase n=1 Tax=Actinomadura sp. 7K507 TaxID=2530365 RepID=UPI00104382BD|nr:alpha/beta hydrolase [Actinomadura sp. 7K507]TDC85732.1 alpha/beta fold hydrolase [Actinomadura sp. 7K507]